MEEVERDADWRSNRKTHWDFLASLMARGIRASLLFTAPYVTIDIFRMDWLHAGDQGVTPDYLGNLFKVCTEKFDAGTKKARVSQLWKRLLKWYRDNLGVIDKLPTLTEKMIQADGHPPKLRGSAACMRALVPFGEVLAEEMLDGTDLRESAMITCARELHACYKTLSSTCEDHAEKLLDHSIRYAVQFKALRRTAGNDVDWKLKPKIHMWLELCAEKSRPSQFWCYRDEDYGGTVAALARRRGGKNSAQAMSETVLDLFAIKQPMVRLR